MLQPFVFPRDLFSSQAPAVAEPWLCVRTRSRAEKRFSHWLSGRGKAHFLPILHRDALSHRRLRTVQAPLFSGYVFVAGEHDKGAFKTAAAVVEVLPSTQVQRLALHGELWSLWRGLESGSPLELARALEPGEMVEVVSGALKGIRGRFQRWGKYGRLILWVDMLGAGAAVEIDETSVVRAV